MLLQQVTTNYSPELSGERSGMDQLQLTEQDIHCIAMLIQSSFCAPNQETIKTYRSFYGCMYCKYAVSECNSPDKLHWKVVFKKLNELTGIHLSTCISKPENIGKIFLPESHYLKHPEDINELERIHDLKTVGKIKACLDKVISYSKENLG